MQTALRDAEDILWCEDGERAAEGDDTRYEEYGQSVGGLLRERLYACCRLILNCAIGSYCAWDEPGTEEDDEGLDSVRCC